MTLGQFILFLIGLAGTIYFVRLWVVDLGFPGSLINLLKRYECPVCHKKHWTPYGKCCQDTPEYKAWHEKAKREYAALLRAEKKGSSSSSPVGMPVEHDCPRCHGKPGDYMCPMCEGRGKTFIW